MSKIDPIPKGLVQVAGVHDLEEAQMLVDAGVDLIGIPLRLTVNAVDLPDHEAAMISRRFPRHCCLITYLDKVDEIAGLVQFLKVAFVQLHGPVDPAIMPGLRKALPRVIFIKSLIVGRDPLEQLLQAVDRFSPFVHAFITDSFDPVTGAEGATGRVHDWRASRQLVSASQRPVILAGGLHAGNVADAIHRVQPWGVDVHTGVERPDGRKDPLLTRNFARSAKAAFAGIYNK